jgi:hypothetical protein
MRRKLFAWWEFDVNHDSKPFSYIVPLSRFPSKSVVYDKTEESKVVNEVPLLKLSQKVLWQFEKEKKHELESR